MHRLARERPTSLFSWSTGNEGADEESKLLPFPVVFVLGRGGWGIIYKRYLCLIILVKSRLHFCWCSISSKPSAIQTHDILLVILLLFTLCCRSCSYLAVQNLVAIFSKYDEFVARIHQSTWPRHVVDLPIVLSTETQYHSSQGHEQRPPGCASRGWTFWRRSSQRFQEATWYLWKHNDVTRETVFNSSSTRVVDSCTDGASFSNSFASKFSLAWGKTNPVLSWEHDRAADKFNKHLKCDAIASTE